MIYTIKDGKPFGYDASQTDLYNHRIAQEGHSAATQEEVDELNKKPITTEGLKSIVTAFRWQVETGGITLPGGVRVATRIDDQNRITSVVANAERAGVADVDFKAASGWVRLTLGELRAVAVAVALHVQACFSAERAHHQAIDALVAEHAEDLQALQQALDAYDIEHGWPSTDLTVEALHD